MRGTAPRFVEFANYTYITGSGKNQSTHRWGYVAIKLDVPLPNIVLDDVPGQTRRTVGEGVELGHRGFFRSPSELVVVRGSSVGVVDLTKN